MSAPIGNLSVTPPRSSLPQVRNPIMELPEYQALAKLPAESRAAIRALLLALRRQCLARAEQDWTRNKPWSAAYYRVNATYAYHTSRGLR